MEKIRALFQGSPRHKETKNIDRIRNISILGVAQNDLFSVQIGSKKTILRGFTSFFQNSWIATEVITINCIP